MKNIHILPTDKPSRLYLNGFQRLVLDNKIEIADDNSFTNQHIYITNDEEIKEGDWFYDLDTKYIKIKQSWENSHLDFNGKKIILTDNKDLIKDGVQAIDDEFLEWFVNNPSCEEVKTYIVKLCTNCGQQHCDNIDCRGYKDETQYLISFPNNTTQRIITYCDGYEVNTEKIIIPKEEPKQETLEEEFKFKNRQMGAAGFVGNKIMENMISKFKQETLEEAAERFFNKRAKEEGFENWTQIIVQQEWEFIETFPIEFAKWQQERMYSEEEVFNLCREFAIFVLRNGPSYEKQQEWFEQFKKK